MKKKISLLLLVLMLAGILLSGCTGEQATGTSQTNSPDNTSSGDISWPEKTITILVPFSPGGGADLMTRALQPVLQESLGQTIVVENRTGANGGVAMADLAKRDADGYTFVLTSTGPSTLAPNISDIGYTNEEFEPIAQVADVPTALTVHSSSGITDLDQFIAKAEEAPGSFNYGSSGSGSTHNIIMESLWMNVEQPGLVQHVPFDGGSQAITALLGEQITAAATILTEALPYKESGDFNILGIASAERSELDDSVPTFTEQGYDVVQSTWYGFAAPAGTPPEIISKFDEAVKEALASQEVISVFENIKTPIVYLGQNEFKDKWMKAYDDNAKVVEALGLGE